MTDPWSDAIRCLNRHGLTNAAALLLAHRPATASDMADAAVESIDAGFEAGVVLERDVVGRICMKWLQARTGDMSWSRALVSAPVTILRKDEGVDDGNVSPLVEDRQADRRWRQVHDQLVRIARSMGQTPPRFETPLHTIAFAGRLVDSSARSRGDGGHDG